MGSITISLPDEVVAELQAAASRKNVSPDTIVGVALKNELHLRSNGLPHVTIGELIGEDIGKFEGVPDLSTNPRYLDDFGS